MTLRRTVNFPRRGEVWIVNLDPAVGSEIRKTRPAVVMQNNIANQHSPVTIIAAITSRKNGATYPTEVAVRRGEGGLEKDSLVLLNQIRTVDKQRLVQKLGTFRQETMERVAQAMAISLGLVEI